MRAGEKALLFVAYVYFALSFFPSFQSLTSMREIPVLFFAFELSMKFFDSPKILNNLIFVALLILAIANVWFLTTIFGTPYFGTIILLTLIIKRLELSKVAKTANRQ